MEINKEVVNNMVDERVLSIINELVKNSLNEYEVLNNAHSNSVIELIDHVVDKLVLKINRLDAENTLNIMFIKAVLYSHGLSNGELYNNYKDEWYRLNPSSDYRENDNDHTPEVETNE